jgi:SOS-response transcriptional repressor LexA
MGVEFHQRNTYNRIVAAVVTKTSVGKFSVLYANPPSTEDTVEIGVILMDPAADKLYLRLRQDWDLLIRDEDTWYFEKLEHAIRDVERELGAKAAIDVLLQGSNAVTADEPQTVVVGNYPSTLARLYAKSIPVKVRKFETHLPMYSLRSAAGRFLENSEIEPEGWIEIPESRGLSQGQFIARIQGTSMEPVVPDGSLAVFDTESKGSRVGRLVLVEERRRGGANAYTLKKYVSEKKAFSEDTAERAAIRLLPVNPEHDVIELDPEDERYQIIGFFVRTLDPDLAEALVDG